MKKETLRLCLLNVIWAYTQDPKRGGITRKELESIEWFGGVRLTSHINYLFGLGFVSVKDKKYFTNGFGDYFVSNYCVCD